ncbi:disulfide bond formation protein B [Sphingosinicella rhizophila]|uniref:Disulfide bond formation protein B n=1 Tax=Sphingosinicella rhizophila TaxID=3050082 RepID=A0ABU3Q4G5_9SPHN|nr:disulfide bond formation protein B [Sphingosinicella sp. GR2756]MDT9598172.1 disulfide bond formation protein B [Sphingosinicella sp. GR2756]
MTSLQQARALALLIPAALLAGAYGSQYLGGLHPCEMCYWQRWAHFAALAFALLSFAPMADKGRSLVWLAALSILASGMIGTYHAGVEAGIFEGFTQCTAAPRGESVEDLLANVLDTPIIRCDEVQWSFLGLSMAGWNAIVSIGTFLVIAWLSLRRPRAQA